MKKGNDKQEAAIRTAVNSAGSAVGGRALNQASNAKMTEEALRSAYSKALDGAVGSSELSKRARAVLESTGASQQAKGHFIEKLTIKRYNQAGRLVRKKMVGRNSSTNPGYDATRFIKGRFAGGVQIKSSASGADKAYSQIEKIKPGSARNATLFTCDDQIAAAERRLQGRMRVKGNGVTLKQAEGQSKDGLKAIAKRGSRAGSVARAYGKAGATGAIIGVAIGGAKEARALKNGDISKRHFIENRGVDAVEGGAGAILGAAGASAASAGTGAILGAAGVTITAPISLPAIAAAGTAIGVGFLVQRGGKTVRRKLEESRAKTAEHDGAPADDLTEEMERMLAAQKRIEAQERELARVRAVFDGISN